MKTKKILFILLALFSICPVIHSQKSVDQLFKDFSKEKGVEQVNIGNFTFKFASLFTDVMGVNGVDVLSFDGCEKSIKEKLNQAITSLKDVNYETMVSVNEGSDRTKVLVRIKDESIKELIVLTTGDNPALVRIRGNIKPSDIEKVIKDNNPNK